jgi:hypothetical protein
MCSPHPALALVVLTPPSALAGEICNWVVSRGCRFGRNYGRTRKEGPMVVDLVLYLDDIDSKRRV